MVVESGITLNAIQSGSINIDGDTFELSDEVREAMKEAFDKSMEENARIAEMNAAAHNMVVAEQQGDAMKSVMEDQAKAIEIAGRITVVRGKIFEALSRRGRLFEIDGRAVSCYNI